MTTERFRTADSRIELILAVVALIYVTAAAALYAQTYGVLLRQYATSQFQVLPGMLAFGLVAAAVLTSPRAPLTGIAALLRRRWAGATATILLFFVGAAAFTTFKHQIPDWLPFFADRPLAQLDEILHFGPPWRWAHAIAPQSAATTLYVLYGPVWFAQWLGFMLVAAFLTDDALRVRYLIAFLATLLVLGTIGRMLGASAGPIFFDRMFEVDRFGDLTDALSESPAGRTMLEVSDYLFRSYATDEANFGSGISAMPSIHVAIAVLNAIFLQNLSRPLAVVGWAYAAAIMFGSVYFGWHYALDGYVSFAAVVLIWRGAGAWVLRNGTPAPQSD